MAEGLITPNTQAQKVREELFQISSQEQWKRDDYWKYFLKKRRDIFDTIYDCLDDKNWLNPAVTDCAEEEFRMRAEGHWRDPGEAWVLAGSWVTSRPDIVAWLRSTYWKHNRKRIAERGTAGTGSVPHSNTGLPENYAPTGSGTGVKSWKDTVLQ